MSDKTGIPIITDKAFREIDVGTWESKKFSDLEKEYFDDITFYRQNPGIFRFPNGETYKETAQRASEKLREIAKNNDGKTIVLTTHGGVIRALRTLFSGISWEKANAVPHPKNAAINILSFNNGIFIFLLTDYVEHLNDI